MILISKILIFLLLLCGIIFIIYSLINAATVEEHYTFTGENYLETSPEGIGEFDMSIEFSFKTNKAENILIVFSTYNEQDQYAQTYFFKLENKLPVVIRRYKYKEIRSEEETKLSLQDNTPPLNDNKFHKIRFEIVGNSWKLQVDDEYKSQLKFATSNKIANKPNYVALGGGKDFDHTLHLVGVLKDIVFGSVVKTKFTEYASRDESITFDGNQWAITTPIGLRENDIDIEFSLYVDEIPSVIDDVIILSFCTSFRAVDGLKHQCFSINIDTDGKIYAKRQYLSENTSPDDAEPPDALFKPNVVVVKMGGRIRFSIVNDVWTFTFGLRQPISQKFSSFKTKHSPMYIELAGNEHTNSYFKGVISNLRIGNILKTATEIKDKILTPDKPKPSIEDENQILPFTGTTWKETSGLFLNPDSPIIKFDINTKATDVVILWFTSMFDEFSEDYVLSINSLGFLIITRYTFRNKEQTRYDQSLPMMKINYGTWFQITFLIKPTDDGNVKWIFMFYEEGRELSTPLDLKPANQIKITPNSVNIGGLYPHVRNDLKIFTGTIRNLKFNGHLKKDFITLDNSDENQMVFDGTNYGEVDINGLINVVESGNRHVTISFEISTLFTSQTFLKVTTKTSDAQMDIEFVVNENGQLCVNRYYPDRVKSDKNPKTLVSHLKVNTGKPIAVTFTIRSKTWLIKGNGEETRKTFEAINMPINPDVVYVGGGPDVPINELFRGSISQLKFGSKLKTLLKPRRNLHTITTFKSTRRNWY